MSVLGITMPDPAGQLLNTGYDRFESETGIHGLAKSEENRLDILAVVAMEEGTGQFREFIKQCKAEYTTVCIWEVWNPQLQEVLPRYGFQRTTEFQVDEVTHGWRWDDD